MNENTTDLHAEVTRLKADNAQLAEERDLAVAHDRQPYPTQWAYDQACAALEKHRARADQAERERDALRESIVLERPAELGVNWYKRGPMLSLTQDGITLYPQDGGQWPLSPELARELAAHLAAMADAHEAAQAEPQHGPAGSPRKLADEEIHDSFLSSEEWKDSPTDRAARIYDAQSGGPR